MKQKHLGCQQNLIDSTPILEFICSESNKLTNQGIYYARQLYFKRGRYIGKFDLDRELKSSRHFGAMHSQSAQQTLRAVYESFKSHQGLMQAFRAGKIDNKPKLPNYRKQGGLEVISYPKQALKLKGSMIRVPLGTLVKTWFDIDSFEIKMPTNLEFEAIKELRIVPRNNCFYAEFVYENQQVQADVDPLKALGIDHGVSNWLTCVSNVGTSFIIDGLKLKSLNQGYNRRVATLKRNQPQEFWSKRLASITERRNRQFRDAINKAARRIIDHCILHKIGTVVFGWNKGQKQKANMGSKTNQEFVTIPTARLKTRIEQLCSQFGIRFVEAEESYSSKTSFLDLDFLPKFGEKPEQWKPSGKRVKRGLYRTAKGWLINADCNGAANILRKVSTKLGLDLAECLGVP